MIPIDYITEWRKEAPWATDAQVEQDLIICRAIVNIFTEPRVRNLFAFRGGTALYKLHLRPAIRYSEDIDLVQLSPGPIAAAIDGIRNTLDGWLGPPHRTANEGRIILVYRAISEGQPPVPIRLKIEINSREHFSVLGIEQQEFTISSRWFSGVADVGSLIPADYSWNIEEAARYVQAEILPHLDGEPWKGIETAPP